MTDKEKVDVTKHYRFLFELVGLEWPKNKRAKVDEFQWRLFQSKMTIEKIEWDQGGKKSK